MNTSAVIEQYTVEEMEQVAAGWAKIADDYRRNGDTSGNRDMGAIRWSQDAAAKWMRRAQMAQRVQQGII
jgi:hypothetical protein